MEFTRGNTTSDRMDLENVGDKDYYNFQALETPFLALPAVFLCKPPKQNTKKFNQQKYRDYPPQDQSRNILIAPTYVECM